MLERGSVFFEKLIAGLGGQADTFPIYPDGHRGDGVITVDEIATYLREEVSTSTDQEQIPIPADLTQNRSPGGFFCLSRQRMVANGIVGEWNPKLSTPFGSSPEERPKPQTVDRPSYRIGQAGVAAPIAISKVLPKCPTQLIQVKRKGIVGLWERIEPDGKPDYISFIVHSLDPEFDKSAVEAVRAWRFQPATKNGVPGAIPLIVGFKFEYTSSGPVVELTEESYQ